MSLGSNDCLGATRKGGAISQITLRGTLTDTPAGSGVLAVWDRVDNSTARSVFTVMSDIGTGVTGIIISAPGRYIVEVSTVYASGATRTIYLTASLPLGVTPSSANSFAYYASVTGVPPSAMAFLPAVGGEVIKVHLNAGITADANAYFRITRLD